ncbi:MAG: hypothetical protein NTY99_01945 [DPANN group archaeon]|nr:hypothetical protein [DPANN group archaeon]
MKKGNMLLTLAVVVLVLLVIGLWFYPQLTKGMVGGAVAKAKSVIPK